MSNLAIGERIKDYYESRTQQCLPRRTNLLLRLDGVAFTTFTQGLDRPFDLDFVAAMNATAQRLCRAIPGAKCAFVQSDEITVLVTDYDELSSGAWYDHSVQKLCSVAAGMATAAFNRAFTHKVSEQDGFFDCRVFTVAHAPEVANVFLWRQQDCTRNSIASVAQCLYEHEELKHQNSEQQQELIYQRRELLRELLRANGSVSEEILAKESLQWQDLPPELKRGRLITRQERELPINLAEIPAHVPNREQLATQTFIRRVWKVEPAPRFSQHPEAILSLLPGYVAPVE